MSWLRRMTLKPVLDDTERERLRLEQLRADQRLADAQRKREAILPLVQDLQRHAEQNHYIERIREAIGVVR